MLHRYNFECAKNMTYKFNNVLWHFVWKLILNIAFTVSYCRKEGCADSCVPCSDNLPWNRCCFLLLEQSLRTSCHNFFIKIVGWQTQNRFLSAFIWTFEYKQTLHLLFGFWSDLQAQRHRQCVYLDRLMWIELYQCFFYCSCIYSSSCVIWDSKRLEALSLWMYKGFSTFWVKLYLSLCVCVCSRSIGECQKATRAHFRPFV